MRSEINVLGGRQLSFSWMARSHVLIPKHVPEDLTSAENVFTTRHLYNCFYGGSTVQPSQTTKYLTNNLQPIKVLTQTAAQTSFLPKCTCQSPERVLEVVKKDNYNMTGFTSVIQGNLYFSATRACLEEKICSLDVSLGLTKNSLCQ